MRIILMLPLILLAAGVSALPLEQGFLDPPASARPQVWWHWMGGNVSRRGITADLESMKAVEIGGVTLFNLSCDGTPVGPVEFASPEWFSLVRFAAEECVRLGLEFRIANCAGWTGSGGPWVSVEDSMKEFVFSETNAVPGRSVRLVRPKARQGYYHDIAVVAFRVPEDYRKRPIAGYGVKTCRDFSWGIVQPDRKPAGTNEVVTAESIVDLTDCLQEDGTLNWRVPSGNWRVIRCGYTTTGKCNFPAPRGGAGLEVDKLSVGPVERHFRAHVKKTIDALGVGRRALTGIVVDSYEVGPFSWTEGLERVFKKRRGSSDDVLSLFVALAGNTVESPARTDELLADFRRLVADLFARNYAGTLKRLANAEGLSLAVEPYVSPCDDLQYSRYCDIPMGEIWPSQKDMESCPGSHELPASSAHFWGGRLVDVEAFSQNPSSGTSARWLWDPLSVKSCGDVAFTRGMNRCVINSFAHQPWTVEGPGMTMGFWGIRYDRTEPWWRCTRPFNRYLARCQYLLQEGRIVRDLLVYGGDAAPNRFRKLDTRRFGYDVIGTEGLEAVAVRDGVLVAPSGTRYQALVVQPSEWNGRSVLARIEELRRQGAKIGATAAVPDVEDPSGSIRWIHRTYEDGSQGYFVCTAGTNAVVKAKVSFRQRGSVPELWDPESGEIRVPTDWREVGGRTEVTLSLGMAGSVFVMFRPRLTAGARPEEKLPELQLWRPEWEIAFPGRKAFRTRELFDWAKSNDDEVRYFTGTAVYRAPLAAGSNRMVDFGEVRDFAEVLVDGRMVAILWKPPYRCRLPAGKTLEVRVTNGWANRMIGDERTREPDVEMTAKCGWTKVHGFGMSGAVPKWVLEGKPSPTGRRSFATWKHWLRDDPPQPSGLLGPVRLECR